MIETHPFGDFIPKNIRFLLTGSFTAKRKDGDTFYDWFYANKRNQFWSIIEAVYDMKLESTASKQELFHKLGMGISDIIYQCERKENSSLDKNLVNIVYNTNGIKKIL